MTTPSPKHLTLIRHAKSSWKRPLPDFDRPLNNRGKRNAGELGQWLDHQGIVFDRVVTSPARRAIDTVHGIGAWLPQIRSHIVTEPSLYHASPGTLLDVIRQQDDRFSDIALVGHNPGLSELAWRLLPGAPFGDLRTSACVRMIISAGHWQKVSAENTRLLFYHDPKTECFAGDTPT